MGGKAKRKVKTKEKKQKPPRNQNKGAIWSLQEGKIVRTHRTCPKCGPAVYMAEHYDRSHCGRCGYTLFKRQNAPTASGSAEDERMRRRKKE